MNRVTIKKNQVWRHKTSGKRVFVFGKKKGDRWIINSLEGEHRNTSNSHTVRPETLWRKFELVV